jgi:hypothetical protein
MNTLNATPQPPAGLHLRRRTVWILGIVFCVASNLALLAAAVQVWKWLDRLPQVQLSLVIALCAIAAGVRVAIRAQHVISVTPAPGRGRSSPCEQ